jgi:PAS domain S-box-containing protein
MYSFGVFSVLSLVVSEMYFVIGIYIFLRNPRSTVNRLYLLVALTMGIWGLGEGMQRASADPSTAFFWAGYVTGIGSAFHVAFLMHFWLAFSGQASRFKRIPVYVIYLPAAIFVAMRLLYPDLLISGVQLEYWGYSTEGTRLYLAFMAYVAAYSSAVAFMALRASFRVTGALKKHTRNMGLAVLLVVALGIVTQLSRPLLHLPIPELTVISAIIFTSVIAYTVSKYGMLSISVKMLAENIVGTMEDYVIGIDKEKRITIVNNSALANLGYKKEDLVGKPLGAVLSIDVSPMPYDAFLQQFPLTDHQAKVVSKDGISFPVSTNASVVRDRDEVLGFVFVLRDMRKINELIESLRGKTGELNEKVAELEKNRLAVLNMMEDSEQANRELVGTQEDLRRAVDELKKAEVKKDEFISVTAHEFKTPLTAIRGFAELLNGGKVDEDARKKYLGIMIQETKRLARLVTDILDLSRMDLGTFKLNLESVPLGELVDGVCSEMQIPLKQKGLTFSYAAGKGLPKAITTDPERLKQVLINLLTNAIKYTPKGGISLEVSKDDDFVRFTIRDTGIGIPSEEIPKLFHRFYQIDSSYTREQKGSGLGLAISKEFVTKMGGKIWIESEVNKGSTFHFTVPIAPGPAGNEGLQERLAESEQHINKQPQIVK